MIIRTEALVQIFAGDKEQTMRIVVDSDDQAIRFDCAPAGIAFDTDWPMMRHVMSELLRRERREKGGHNDI